MLKFFFFLKKISNYSNFLLVFHSDLYFYNANVNKVGFFIDVRNLYTGYVAHHLDLTHIEEISTTDNGISLFI